MHLTGLYPDWWQGRRFKRPVHAWASSVTNEATRDNPQNKLLGPSKAEMGSGAIPLSCIDMDSMTWSRALSNLCDTVRIHHISGGLSYLSFKSYVMGEDKWQGPTLDIVWCDEEPPAKIYSEGLARTNLGTRASDSESGMMMLTCTPLKGMTDVMSYFYPEPSTNSRHMTMMDIWDLEGVLYSEQQIKDIVESYPSHERDARSRGIPMMGTGRVYPIDESLIMEEAFKIPHDWRRLAGIDIGWDHPTAVVHLALEPFMGSKDFIAHVYACYAAKEEVYAVHADAIKQRGDWIPVAWPHDANKADPNSGISVAGQYRAKGVNMLHEHATFYEGGFSVETGVQAILNMMKTGRFKVFSHLRDWFHEFRHYHRAVPKGAIVNKAPQIVKVNDDRMDATRYAFMMNRYAKAETIDLAYRHATAGMNYNPLEPATSDGSEVFH